MSNRCHRWVIDRLQNLIIANNQWLIKWILIDYSLITNWCHWSSISYVWYSQCVSAFHWKKTSPVFVFVMKRRRIGNWANFYFKKINLCEKITWLLKDLTLSVLQMNTWNNIYLNCGERYEFMVDHRSYTHNLSSCEI